MLELCRARAFHPTIRYTISRRKFDPDGFQRKALFIISKNSKNDRQFNFDQSWEHFFYEKVFIFLRLTAGDSVKFADLKAAVWSKPTF